MTDQHELTAPDRSTPARERIPAKGHPMWIRVGLFVVLIASILRFWDLPNPTRCYFDETYYYYDARDIQVNGVESAFVVHPPVGKQLISLGLMVAGVDRDGPLEKSVINEVHSCNDEEGEEPNVQARGREAYDSLGRRLASALFGSIAVLATWLAGLHFFRMRSTAAFAAALLAMEGLALTLSRVAMLDIFLQAFVMIGLAAMLRDQYLLWRDVPEPGEAVDPGAVPPVKRHWLYIAGVCMGLAFATKWSATMPWGLMCLWIWGSEMLRMRRLTGKFTSRFFPILLRGLFAMLVIPLTVYVLSYAGWFMNWQQTSWVERHPDAACVATECTPTEQAKAMAESWVDEQKAIYNFHKDLKADHSYRAPAWTWFIMQRPVAFYYEECTGEKRELNNCVVAEKNVAEIIGMGNPFIWWMALASYVLLLAWTLKYRDWRSLLVLVFVLGQTLPYFLSPRTVFLFYMAPVVPFMCLGLGVVAERYAIRRYAWVGRTIMILAGAAFIYWSPIFYGWEISRTWWKILMWLPSWI